MTAGGDPGPVARFFGGLLMVAGGLIALTAGLCSTFILVAALSVIQSNPSDLVDSIPMVLGAGGIPFGVGLALFFIGRSLYRGASPDREP